VEPEICLEERLLRNVLGIALPEQAATDRPNTTLMAVEELGEAGPVAGTHRRDELAIRSLSHSVLLLRPAPEVLLDSVRISSYSGR
jgi:hypothetical protein